MQVRTDKEIGLLIRDRRKNLGLDQATLASQVDVSRQRIVEVEKGKSRAEIGLILRTLRVLGLELNATVAGAPPSQVSSATGLINIDAVINRARGVRDPK